MMLCDAAGYHECACAGGIYLDNLDCYFTYIATTHIYFPFECMLVDERSTEVF